MAPSPPPPKRPWFKKKRFVTPLALLAMFFIVGLAGGCGSDPATVAAAPATDSASKYVPDPTQFPSDEATEEPTKAAPTKAAKAAPTKTAKAAPTKAAPTKEPKPKHVLSAEQQEAVGSALDYLDSQGFSQYGLIHQLSSKYGSGFKKEDATIAVESLHINYNKQAVRVAKDYRESMHFSRYGLIHQLSSKYGSGFTYGQAVFGTDHSR